MPKRAIENLSVVLGASRAKVDAAAKASREASLKVVAKAESLARVARSKSDPAFKAVVPPLPGTDPLDTDDGPGELTGKYDALRHSVSEPPPREP